jgi:Fibronectin type III domain
MLVPSGVTRASDIPGEKLTMNIKNRVRRAVVAVALASSVATAIGAAGAAQADDVPADPPTTEVPPVPPAPPAEEVPPAEEAPPGPDAGATETPPAAGDDTAAPSTTTPPTPTEPTTPPAPTEPAEEPAPTDTDTTVPAQSGKTVSTTPPSAIATPTTTAPSEAIATLASATAATAPRSPVAKPANGSVKLTWLAPSSNGGATITYYGVQRSTNGTTWVYAGSPAGTTINVGGLTNGTRYYFRVRAHNSAGFGPFSAVVNAVPRKVPTAPRSPVAKPGNKTVKLTWTAPSSNGGAAIDRYQVWRYTTSTGWKNIASPTGRSYQVPNLVNGTKYSFRIRAHNAAGYGPFSTVVTAVPRTVPNAPTAPTVTVGDGSVTLKWQPPSGNGAAVDYYQVQRATSPVSWTPYPIQKPTEFIQLNLINGGSYYYQVRAHNAAGWSPFSPVVTGVPKTVPTAPTMCTASGFEVTKKWVSFGYQPPSSIGGAPITLYVIKVYQNGIHLGTTSQQAGVGGGVIQVLYSGNYDVYIYAWNSAGVGPACHTTTSVPVP